MKGLAAILSTFFQSRADRDQDDLLLAGLSVGDKMDEALAYAVLLTQLAMCDGKFDQAEHSVISNSIAKLFPEHVDDSATLIQTAKHMLTAFRGVNSYVDRIKEEYSIEERERLYDLIEGVINADGHEDQMETYLRDKFKQLLA